jgi:hypothetical protein
MLVDPTRGTADPDTLRGVHRGPHRGRRSDYSSGPARAGHTVLGA